jgi:hypothetical protein
VHLVTEVAEHVLSSFGRLMASPDAARHVHEALFYLFEGYETRDGEVLFARIERTVKEAVRKAEEAGIPDAEYRIKQFVLEVIDVLARAGERYRRQALEGVSTVEKALRATAFAGLSAAALYSVYHGLYSEAVVSSVASAVALVDVGRFKEAVEYVQKAAKALYEAARDVFEHVKVTVQRLVELFVEAVARALAWIDEHKAYLFLMAAVAAGAVALATALNIWGLIELDKLAYAASLTPFVPAGVKEYSREEVFNILKNDPDPYERFKKIVEEANRGEVKLAEPWESLRKLIMPRSSEEERLMSGWGAELYSKYREDEKYKRALFYAILALEEAFGVYRSALREYAEGLKKAVQRVEVGAEPFERVAYVADLGQIKRLAEEEGKAFEDALSILRRRLNEYAVRYNLRDLLDVNEGKARGLAEAKAPELSEFGGANYGVKAYAALIAYREYALGGRVAFGRAARYWLEVGGSAWLLYYAPSTAYLKAEKAKAGRPTAVEELVAEGLRRLFLKPGADRYRGFVEELTKGGRLALMLEDKTKSSYVFKLYNMKEGGGLVDLGTELWIAKVGEGERAGVTYTLILDAERWREFFRRELEAAEKAAEEVGRRLPVEDLFSYMLGWVDSDVAITRNKKGERVLRMTTSHLWQFAETHALFGWSVGGLRMTSTLEGPKLQVVVEAPLDRLDEAVRRSVGGGWLKTLGVRAESWDDLKRWVAKNWDVVVDAAARRLGEGIRGELVALKDKLKKDKVAREVVAPALLLIQAERLGVNEETLRYFGAVISGAVGGDGHVSAARGVVGLTSGEREVALQWAAAFAAYSAETKVEKAGGAFRVLASDEDAVKLAGLYFLYGPPVLEGDERIINRKLAEAAELGAEGLNVRWEGLRGRTEGGPVAADLIISVGGVAVKYNVYLSNEVKLHFKSTDRSRVELAARLLKLAGVNAEVKKVGDKEEWLVYAYTDMLAAGHEKLRKALAEIVKTARKSVGEEKAKRWLEKLKRGRVLMEGWPKYLVRLHKGALEVRFASTNPNSIEREAQRLRERGLVEGEHFTVKKDGKKGYVRILKDGLAYAAWLSDYGPEDKRKLARELVDYILQRARDAGDDVLGKVEEIIAKSLATRVQDLKNFKEVVEINGKKYVVNVTDGEAKTEDKRGKKYLKIRITAEVSHVEGGHAVDHVKREYTITFSRRGAKNAVRGSVVVKTETDAEILAAVIKALTGEEPWIQRIKDGTIMIVCGRKHLEGFKRYNELADAIEKWLEETSRRA